ncbi:unnamed protein product, partial [Brassica oleracea]
CREVITISNQHINSKNSNLRGRIWRRRATMTRKKEREREKTNTKRTRMGYLVVLKPLVIVFFFWFFFRTFYEALPWNCSNHPEKETLSLFDHLERESGFLSSTGSLPVQRTTTISAMQ